MAIQTAGEFEIQVNVFVLMIDRVLVEQPRHAGLLAARRDLLLLVEWVKKGTKPALRQVQTISSTTASALQGAFRGDEALLDRFYDLVDFVELRSA